MHGFGVYIWNVEGSNNYTNNYIDKNNYNSPSKKMKYEGQWNEGKKHGKGKLINNDFLQ